MSPAIGKEIAAMPAAAETMPVATPVQPPRYEAAAQLLEKAVGAGSPDANVQYMLAMAYKRQKKYTEARATLRKIQKPDANVFLQMGLISLEENQLEQAEQEFARAWSMDATSFALSYNLLMTRLTLGQFDKATEMMPRAAALAKTFDQQRFIRLLQALLDTMPKGQRTTNPRDLPPLPVDSPLHEINADEEKKLLRIIRSLGQIDTIFALLQTLAMARNGSRAVQDAYYDCALVRARELMARARWSEAESLLEWIVRERNVSRSQQLAAFNLLGAVCYLTQDFDRAGSHFSRAVKIASNDARLQQNLALAYEMQGQLTNADSPWNRFFDLLEGGTLAVPDDIKNYQRSLLFEGLCRLANLYADKEKWPTVLTYLQRAHKIRPDDEAVIERLFHTYTNAKRPDNAKRMLEKLRNARPNDPQIELFELDLIEVKKLDDIEKLLTDIDRIRRRYPGDHRVEERAVGMVGNVIPLMGKLCDQLTDQLNKVMDQVRRLPRYQIDWGALREVLRDLSREFQKLRRITGKCLPLVTSDEHRRIVRDLAEHIDEKIDLCRDLQRR